MLCVCLAAVLVAVASGAPSLTAPWADIQEAEHVGSALHFYSDEAYAVTWEVYKSRYAKSYGAKEDSFRRDVYIKSAKRVMMHNYLYSKGKSTFTLALNEFSDLTSEEFTATKNGYRRSNKTTGDRLVHSTYMSPASPFAEPSEVDWTKKGYVTPVKNQLACGSCWAFSTTGSVEGQHFHKSGKLVSLSEQQLVDCSKSYGNQGCNGGLMDHAFQYIKDNGGIDTEESYPYEAKDGVCRFKPQDVGATVTGLVDVATGDEAALKQATASIGPISVAIDASHPSFQAYESGVYTEAECSSRELDHGVLVVGYGTEDGQDYWLVKNSWGPSWGDKGYIKMARNMDNQCGIATSASYPLV